MGNWHLFQYRPGHRPVVDDHFPFMPGLWTKWTWLVDLPHLVVLVSGTWITILWKEQT